MRTRCLHLEYSVKAEGVNPRAQRGERRYWIAVALAIGVCLVAARPTSGAADIVYGGDAHGMYNFDIEGYAAYGQQAYVYLEDSDLGVVLGERLVGQVNQPVATFDVITGVPSLPLAIDASVDPLVAVNTLPFFGTTIVTGLGPVGYPEQTAIGDGSVTVLFARDQQVVAFEVSGASRGAMHMLFYGRSGELLSELEVLDVTSTTHVFSSSERDIAALTINNSDPGGLGFDNFRFVPGPPDRESRCLANGPYFSDEREWGYANVYLDGAAVDDPAGILHDYQWMSDCPGAEFWDSTDPVTILYVEASDPCRMECSVTLMVDDGLEADVCTTNVTIDGEGGGGSLECPADLTVESDGQGNLADLEDWLASAVSDDPDSSDDFIGMTYECGYTGSVTVTWESGGDASGGCSGAAQCSASFTVVDTTAPVLHLDATPIVVEDLDCSGDEYVTLPDVTATDEGGAVEVVIDAPDSFPLGTRNVTYTATDECGLSSSANLEVVVLAGSGVEVSVAEHVVGSRKNATKSIPLAGVPVAAYDASRWACVARVLAAQPGEVGDVYGCPLVGSGVTDTDGMCWVAVPPGRYVVVAEMDRDGDGLPDVAVGHPTGKVRCGQWKRARLDLLVDADGEVVPYLGK